jgi:hypothetical protein
VYQIKGVVMKRETFYAVEYDGSQEDEPSPKLGRLTKYMAVARLELKNWKENGGSYPYARIVKVTITPMDK